ncbi:TPA: helix-turn-helix transcriptional regulator [Klebsiella pneumoniae]|uniref:helix-turn-helix domain-containing protein n=1 Tax=Klebsiella pneumoniae TaxID=573 RepID=UPI001E3C5CE6|nr:helix-turn-helix transcriptional regulator [Klebsiella pneumoniae]MCD5937001.1 helix-turn-helix transcriptional regulator [Klebsiella pneumoniae]HBS7549510.1 helix-turn-helix transcriptional regulator [Klebsiella pneumoniae]HBU3718202.1 helix-turn-helix transcriptional regulator [Klebsiella pneumoniae]HBX5355695.1 XRE family transcriptional regulator [Klebsiella pneumoniae]HBY4307917.1 XRE family transcriptional regulator [Klebsiella pneumoniae]
MSRKNIPWEEARAVILNNPEAREAYEFEIRAEKMAALLESWRKNAGLTTSQVAEKMGVSQSTVSRLENNAIKAGVDTLYRYARACGVTRFEIVI